jgi:sugar phosphate isomerase/epimerase
VKVNIIKRREFIAGSAVAAAGFVRVVRGEALPDQDKRDRMAVMTLSFNSVLKNPEHPDDPARTLDILDAPQMIADRYGIHHVEFQHTHFASIEAPYFKEIRDRLKKAKSQMNQICLEFGPLNISAPEHYVRLETIDLTKQWIDHAAAVGCPRVMVNQGTLAPEVRQAAIDTLKAMDAYGKTRKVFVTMENRGGGARRPPQPGDAAAAQPSRPPAPPPPSWDVVLEVIKASGIHANPDIGNFPDDTARAAGLRAMYPLSSGSSHAHYAPDRYSEADAIKISKEVGYKGLFSIETGRNNGPDPYAAVQSVVDELLKDI